MLCAVKDFLEKGKPTWKPRNIFFRLFSHSHASGEFVYRFANRRAFLSLLTVASSLGSISRATAVRSFFQNGEQENGKDKSSDEPVYEPGGDVKPPKLIHYVEPEFSPSAKEAYLEGTVKISTVVTQEGKPTECRVSSGLSAEEDRSALEALKQWTFHPGTKGDKPVKVRITVQIDFHLL
jgi:TonB family protein